MVFNRGIHNTYSLLPDHGEGNAQGNAELSPSEDTNNETISPDMASHGESPTDDEPMPQMAVIDPQDLVKCTFLLDEQDDGQCVCARIVECIAKHDKQARMAPKHIQPIQMLSQ